MLSLLLKQSTKKRYEDTYLDNVRNLLGNRTRDFVTAVDEKNIIVVKELEPNDGHTELEKIAENMYTLLKEDGEEDVLIAYGTVVNDIKEVSKSYKEAKSHLMSERFSLVSEVSSHIVLWE